MEKKKIRVMITDDSAFARDIISTILSSDPDIEIAGMACDGQEALDRIMDIKPDLITMDIVMPRMGGLEAIEHIMAFYPTPILVVTSQQDAHIAFQALNKGALEVVEKPSFEKMGIRQEQEEFISKVKLLSKVKVITHLSGRKGRPQTSVTPREMTVSTTSKVIAIASSTGGPKVIAKILAQLSADIGVSVLLVQHIADGFSQSLVDWLDGVSPIKVKLAQSGEKIEPGKVFIAPTGQHMEVKQKGIISLTAGPPEEGQRPSANVLLRSVAKTYGRSAMGVILTGMGNDGAAGILEMKRSGAKTVAQNEESCVVFGMPKVAIEMGAIEKVLAIDGIAEEINKFAK